MLYIWVRDSFLCIDNSVVFLLDKDTITLLRHGIQSDIQDSIVENLFFYINPFLQFDMSIMIAIF